MFCYSRDRAVPFSSLWVRVDKRTRTPQAALWVSLAARRDKNGRGAWAWGGRHWPREWGCGDQSVEPGAAGCGAAET
jgi:hypothetical protein